MVEGNMWCRKVKRTRLTFHTHKYLFLHEIGKLNWAEWSVEKGQTLILASFWVVASFGSVWFYLLKGNSNRQTKNLLFFNIRLTVVSTDGISKASTRRFKHYSVTCHWFLNNKSETLRGTQSLNFSMRKTRLETRSYLMEMKMTYYEC